MGHDSDQRIELILDSLNREQRQAVSITEGPLLVLAGAGSGKTRVITVRAAYLLARGVDPSQILAVTFTNKAAAELRARLASLVGRDSAAELTIGTFHAFCLGLLRENLESLKLGGGFTLCDPGDQLAGVRQVLRELRVAATQVRPKDALGVISLCKNRMLTPEAYAKLASTEREELMARAYKGYEAWLRRSRILDFDDLLLRALELLRDHPALRETYRRRYRYLMVDEYQDTNLVQYEFLRQLAGSAGNLCAVGDDDQSIYAWRGADVAKILGFERDFAGSAVVKLETNYRSTPQILKVANQVIRNNLTRFDKTLRPALPSGAPVELYASPEEVSEADVICLEIREKVERRQARFSEFAVLFRTATQPRAVEAQLRLRRIPYVLVGGASFFDRKEVKDLMAYLRAALNPDDEPAFLRIVERPPRGIGRASVEKTLAFATAAGISVGAAFERSAEIPGVPGSAVRAAQVLRQNLSEWAAVPAGKDLAGRIRHLIELVGYRSEIERSYPDELTRTQRLKVLDDVLDMARHYARRSAKPSLAKFLEELCLNSGDDNEHNEEDSAKREVVTLMTLHAAKGLEFNHVYLIGLEEGILPHSRALAEDGLEEERRLFYVGVTRARKRLVLSRCTHRVRAGHKLETHASRFLYEVRGEAPPPEWRAAGSSASSPPAPKTKGRKKSSSAGGGIKAPAMAKTRKRAKRKL